MTVVGEAFVEIRPQVESFAGHLKEGVTGALDKLGPLGGGLLGVAAAGVAVGGALYKIGETFDAAYDKIRVGTGATGAQMDNLKGVFRGVVADVPTSFGNASAAITTLAQRTGLAGPPLKDLAERQLELARITKQDLNTSVEETSKAFANFGIAAKDQAPKLDELFRASQRTGVTVPVLAQELQKTGPILRGLGLNFEQSTALLAQLNKEGISSGPVMAGLRKSIAEFAKEGKSAPEAIHAVFDSIKNAKTPTEATTEALKVFGTRAGPQLVDAIRGGKLAYEDLAKTLGKGDTIKGAAAATDDLGEKFTLLKNRTFLLLEPLASKVFDGVGIAFDKISGAVKALTPELTRLKDIFVFALNPKAEVDDLTGLEAVVGHLAKAFVTVRDAVEKAFTFLAAHRPILIGLGIAVAALVAPFLTLAAGAVYLYGRFQVVRDVVHAVTTAIAAAFRFVNNVVVPIVAQIAEAVVGRFRLMFAFVQSISGPFIEAAGHIFNAIRDVVTPIIQALEAIWRVSLGSMLAAASAIFDAIKTAIETAVGVIEGIIRLVLDLINGNWSKAWHDLLGIVTTVFSGIVRIVGDEIKAVLDIIVGVLASIGTGLENGVGGVLNFFKDLPGRLVSAAAAEIGQLTAFGGAIINGLKSGVEAAFGAVVGFFSSIGSRILSSIKSGLGPLGKFLSPKTQFGVDVGNGLILGIQHAVEANGHLATGAADKLAQRLRGALSGVGGPGLPPLASRGVLGGPGGLSLTLAAGAIRVELSGAGGAALAPVDVEKAVAAGVEAGISRALVGAATGSGTRG